MEKLDIFAINCHLKNLEKIHACNRIYFERYVDIHATKDVLIDNLIGGNSLEKD